MSSAFYAFLLGCLVTAFLIYIIKVGNDNNGPGASC